MCKDNAHALSIELWCGAAVGFILHVSMQGVHRLDSQHACPGRLSESHAQIDLLYDAYLPLVGICLVALPESPADKGLALLRGDPPPHLKQHLLQLLPCHLDVTHHVATLLQFVFACRQLLRSCQEHDAVCTSSGASLPPALAHDYVDGVVAVQIGTELS